MLYLNWIKSSVWIKYLSATDCYWHRGISALASSASCASHNIININSVK